MIWKLFDKKRKADVSFLKVDMHNHLLPGIDDGLKNVDDTLRFIDELRNLGYQKLICTPHILSGVHDNSPDTILPALEKVRDALAEKNIEFPIEAAAEYMVDNNFEELLMKKAPLLTLGNNHILIEMSYVAPSPNLK
ncbi:MAG: CpsB/CapC family capsule biosynthesis tyrosine phosphatase, partial [Chitinophagaceae bacterium]